MHTRGCSGPKKACNVIQTQLDAQISNPRMATKPDLKLLCFEKKKPLSDQKHM